MMQWQLQPLLPPITSAKLQHKLGLVMVMVMAIAHAKVRLMEIEYEMDESSLLGGVGGDNGNSAN
jgi:hypothetical protein